VTSIFSAVLVLSRNGKESISPILDTDDELVIRITHQNLTGALNLQRMEFARKGGGNCKERKICKERPQNSQPCEFARNVKECVSYSLL